MVSSVLGEYHHTCIKILWEVISIMFDGFFCFVLRGFLGFVFVNTLKSIGSLSLSLSCCKEKTSFNLGPD